MNVISISGQLGKDAEQKFLPDGTAILNFSVADDQGKTKPPLWWSCAIFGKRAESGLAQYLVKGQAVTVNGTVSMREYEKDGVKRQAFDIRVNDVALQGGAKQAAAPAGNGRGLGGYEFPQPTRGGAAMDDEEIPFSPISRAALMSI